MLLGNEDVAAFRRAKEAQARNARQTAALFLACGLDLQDALSASGEEKEEILRRLRRCIERERLKGMRRHWSYDLNRHIALAQALQRLTGTKEKGRAKPCQRTRPRKPQARR